MVIIMPKNKKNNTGAQLVCNNCGKQGHKPSQCKQANNGKCWKCGNEGHIAAHCQQKQQKQQNNQKQNKGRTDPNWKAKIPPSSNKVPGAVADQFQDAIAREQAAGDVVLEMAEENRVLRQELADLEEEVPLLIAKRPTIGEVIIDVKEDDVVIDIAESVPPKAPPPYVKPDFKSIHCKRVRRGRIGGIETEITTYGPGPDPSKVPPPLHWFHLLDYETEKFRKHLEKLDVYWGDMSRIDLRWMLIIICMWLFTLVNFGFAFRYLHPVFGVIELPLTALFFASIYLMTRRAKRYRYRFHRWRVAELEDLRADSLAVGTLKHKDALIADVIFSERYRLCGFLQEKEITLTASFETLYQISTTTNLPLMYVDEATVFAKMEYAAKSLQSVNINRYHMARELPVVQHAVLICYALWKSMHEKIARVPFPRAPAVVT